MHLILLVAVIPALSSSLPAVAMTMPGVLGAALRWFPHYTGQVAWVTAVGTVSMQPQVSGLPGGSVLQSITNGIGAWALVAALVGLIVGAAAWALGSHSQNYQQSYVGKRTVLVSGLAALLIGAAPGIINFFFQAGSKVH